MTKLTGFNLANSSNYYSRRKLDYYSTPKEGTIALLNFLNLDKSTIIWEPACGNGAISKVMESRGYKVISSDIQNRCYGVPNIDFIKPINYSGNIEWIITNPPFKEAEDFIKICINRGFNGFAFLLKANYWNVQCRIDLFRHNPPTYILPLTFRLDFMNGERGNSPTMDCCWNVWIKGKTETRYLLLDKLSNIDK